MTATAHALIGGAIVAAIPDPILGLPLCALSHPLVDMIPHWDFGWGWRKKTKFKLIVQGSVDLIVGLALAYLLFGQNMDPAYFLAGIFLSEVWDFIQVPYWILGWKFPPFSWFYEFQSKINSKAKTMTLGILTQVGTIAGLIIVLRMFH